MISVALLSRPLLNRLFQVKNVTHKSPGVKQFEELLRTEFESKWAALRKQRDVAQKSLFDSVKSDELKM